MKNSDVPKKVNRHVLKALNTLCDGNIDKIVPTSLIISRVKYQMRNLVPVPNIEQIVQNSLKNLSDFGVIENCGPGEFSIGRLYTPPTPPAKPISRQRRTIRPSVSHKRSRSNFDSTPSSRDENEDKRKLTRSYDKPARYTGLKVNIPKAKRHSARTRDHELDNNMYASNAIDGVDIDWRMGCGEWCSDDQLSSIGHTNHMLSTLPPPVFPLETTEIPNELVKSNIDQQIAEIPNDGSSQRNSGEQKASETNKESLHCPSTTRNMIAVDDKESKKHESAACSNLCTGNLEPPSNSRHFLN